MDIQYPQNWSVLCYTDDALQVIRMVIGVAVGGGAPKGARPRGPPTHSSIVDIENNSGVPEYPV